jgi:hypothetical protein
MDRGKKIEKYNQMSKLLGFPVKFGLVIEESAYNVLIPSEIQKIKKSHVCWNIYVCNTKV